METQERKESTVKERYYRQWKQQQKESAVENVIAYYGNTKSERVSCQRTVNKDNGNTGTKKESAVEKVIADYGNTRRERVSC